MNISGISLSYLPGWPISGTSTLTARSSAELRMITDASKTKLLILLLGWKNSFSVSSLRQPFPRKQGPRGNSINGL